MTGGSADNARAAAAAPAAAAGWQERADIARACFAAAAPAAAAGWQERAVFARACFAAAAPAAAAAWQERAVFARACFAAAAPAAAPAAAAAWQERADIARACFAAAAPAAAGWQEYDVHHLQGPSDTDLAGVTGPEHASCHRSEAKRHCADVVSAAGCAAAGRSAYDAAAGHVTARVRVCCGVVCVAC